MVLQLPGRERILFGEWDTPPPFSTRQMVAEFVEKFGTVYAAPDQRSRCNIIPATQGEARCRLIYNRLAGLPDAGKDPTLEIALE